MRLVIDVHAEEPIDDAAYTESTTRQRIEFIELVEKTVQRFFTEHFEDDAKIDINISIKEDAE